MSIAIAVFVALLARNLREWLAGFAVGAVAIVGISALLAAASHAEYSLASAATSIAGLAVALTIAYGIKRLWVGRGAAKVS